MLQENIPGILLSQLILLRKLSDYDVLELIRKVFD